MNPPKSPYDWCHQCRALVGNCNTCRRQNEANDPNPEPNDPGQSAPGAYDRLATRTRYARRPRNRFPSSGA